MSLVFKQTEGKRKSSKGCWTCKGRKIGCDKSIPDCNNCTRTNRYCEGYGIKLHWPESGDGRRPHHSWEDKSHWHSHKRPIRGNHHFINSTYADLMIALGSRRVCTLYEPKFHPPKSLKFGYETTLGSREATLLSYYTQVLTRMITTIDDNFNGFRTILIPNALAENYISSQSLRYAILALSAFHLWGHEAAVQYKIKAIRLLSQSIQSGEGGIRGKFATCMMLCVCDVFDAADGSWYTHMKAAKAINLWMKKDHFLTTWLLYHDVLADFSSLKTQSEASIFLALPSSMENNQIIIGSLGCSIEVLDCISCINKLARHIDSKEEIHHFAGLLKRRLETLQQVLPTMPDDTTSNMEETRIRNTAELYRLGALIYLHTTTSIPSDTDITQDLVQKCIGILENNGICTSPWPLFIAACEVKSEEQRLRILDVVENMQSERRIGNLDVMRGIIETVWKQMDLMSINGNGGKVNWRKFIDMRKHIPSFI